MSGTMSCLVRINSYACWIVHKNKKTAISSKETDGRLHPMGLELTGLKNHRHEYCCEPDNQRFETIFYF